MLSPDWKIVIKFTCVSTATLGLRYGPLFKNVVMALSSKAWSLVDPYYTAGIRNFKAEPVELNGVLCKIERWDVTEGYYHTVVTPTLPALMMKSRGDKTVKQVDYS